MTPMPPAWAMAMASRPSVTVSMAEEMTGILTEISRVTREATSASPGSTSEGRGTSSTSSKVSATAAFIQDRPLRHSSLSLPSGWPKTGAPRPLLLGTRPMSRPCGGIVPSFLLAEPTR